VRGIFKVQSGASSSKSMNDFDLFRLSKSKAAVDICVTTIRKYFKQGLPFYKRGKVVFVSRRELDSFIRASRHAS